MRVWGITKKLTFLLAVATLAACGDQDGFSPPNGSTGTSTTVTVGGTATATCAVGTDQLGNGTGSSFVQGTLAVGLSSLSAGGNTSITANLVDCNNNPITVATDISFSSTCTGLTTATLTSPVTSNNGTAVSTYVAQGCQGDDVITASAIVGATTLTATGTVNVLSAAVGSIEFVSATPQLIALQGTGGVGLTENSTVIFRVRDISGGTVANTGVIFSLSTTVGGVSLSSTTGTTSATGEVQTIVQSGTVPTSVRVTATITGISPSISTQSDQLVVSVGLPDNDSFTMTFPDLAPESWEYVDDCGQIPDEDDFWVNVFLADHFNNPVPDGTAVTFTSEGGFIQPSCTTIIGTCRARWCSTNPKPATGRVTITAVALGVESFDDYNGNGVFDDGEAYTDLPEAFRDDNENSDFDLGIYNFDIGIDELFDFNVNGIWDVADGEYNGVLCNPSNTVTPCSVNQTLNVRSSLVLIMASSSQIITSNQPTNLNVSGGPVTVTFTIRDIRNQHPPTGTTFKFDNTNGTDNAASLYTQYSNNIDAPATIIVTISPDGTSSTGTYTLTVTTPKSVITIFTGTLDD